MTLTDTILKSLDEIGTPANYVTIYNHIAKNNYYDFGDGKTPKDTVSSILVKFIQNGDSRVKRIKQEGMYHYYLTEKEQSMSADILSGDTITYNDIPLSGDPKQKKKSEPRYQERSLHKLLSSFLRKSESIFSKTIFHEQSKSGQNNNQTWTHPDMVGVKFLELKSKTTKDLLKSVNKFDLFKISSYELKREINSDSELKMAFFQAVSNSSWANYGYLVAFEFRATLNDEMERLNQSFGIGIIQLDPNPYLSKVLFPAKYRELDFMTIDKLCGYSPEFGKFIEQTGKLINAQEGYYDATKKELGEFCDKYFESDEEAEKYCKENNIPFESTDISSVSNSQSIFAG